jgi:[ribosomal protein S5]-alanine N-acetyltransferase
MTTIVARTARQILRQFELRDAPAIFALNADPEVVRYTGDGPFASVEEALAFLKLMIRTAKRAWDAGHASTPRGLCTEALQACLALAFGSIGLTTVVARADPANVASIRVMQKIGMRYEGPSTFAGHPAVLYRLDKRDYAGAPT